MQFIFRYKRWTPHRHRQALKLALPMVFANAAEPLASMVDTAVIGAAGDQVALGGVALGVSVLNFVFYTAYFLRMTTTGATAQAVGAGDVAASHRTLVKGVLLGLSMGLLAILAIPVISKLAFAILQGSADVEAAGASYYALRSLGLPAALVTLAQSGWLIAQGRGRSVLVQQLSYSGINIGLDLLFVLQLDWGLAGLAAATVIANYLSATVGFFQIYSVLQEQGGLHTEARTHLFSFQHKGSSNSSNFDFIIRTWTIIFSFAWFVNASAMSGTEVLAANHVLMQFINGAAFLLDAFVFVVEAEVGKAVGAKTGQQFKDTIRTHAEIMVVFGLLFSLGLLFIGPAVIDAGLQDPSVQTAAKRGLPYCAVTPLIALLAFLLDGVFVGAMASKAMRNAALSNVVIYLVLDHLLRQEGEIDGLWIAFLGYYLSRGLTLAFQLPTLYRKQFSSSLNGAVAR